MQRPGAWQGKCLLRLFREALYEHYLVPVDGIEAANKTDKCCKLPHKMPLYGLDPVLSILRCASL